MGIADEIKTRLDIVDVISDTVTLKKSGRNYIGFCPFHSNTKTPSFVVFPETQTWRCFGACADGGDIFSFVMKREGFEFKEALELLAGRAGLQLDHATSRTSEQEAQYDKLLELHAAVAAYYHNLLTTSPAAEKVRTYLVGRELTSDTIATFQLGYALDEWEALKGSFMQRGYTAEELLAAGLIVERDDGRPGYDRFRNRLIIPIRDPRGRVTGFGARAVEEEQVPKYLNSPQTVLFDKSATLYGLDLARKHIRQSNQAVIVEGYMDVIQAYQRGAYNVVAQMGTALTESQLKRVAPLANRIVLALDADAAGNAATIRSLSLAHQWLPREQRRIATSRGIAYEAHIRQEICIAALPPGQDPDDVLKQGLEVWQELVDQAVSALDFYEALILSQADLSTPQGKSFVVQELIPVYREIADEIERAARVQRLARKIGLNERLLMAELKGGRPQPAAIGQRRKGGPPLPPPEPVPGPAEAEGETPARAVKPPDLGLEEYCLSLILASPAALATANELLENQGVSGLEAKDFEQRQHREIFQVLLLWTACERPNPESLSEMVAEWIQERLEQLIEQARRRPRLPTENISRDLSMAVLRLHLQNLARQIEDLNFLQQEATAHNNREDIRHYTELVNSYREQRKKMEQVQDALSLLGQRRAEVYY